MKKRSKSAEIILFFVSFVLVHVLGMLLRVYFEFFKAGWGFTLLLK